MRTLSSIYLGCVFLFISISCKQELGLDSSLSTVPVVITSKGKGGLQASTTPIAGATPSFGLYMLPSATLDLSQALESNRKYEYTASDIELVGQPIYYPQLGDVRLVAYAPYVAGLSGHTLPLDISDQSDLTKLDLLYSPHSPMINKSTGPVNLTFAHQLSRVKFLVQAEESSIAQQLSAIEINLQGFYTQADFDLTTGTFSGYKAQADLAIAQAREAIVLPAEGESGRQFMFKLGGQVWTYSLPNDDAFASGKEYQYAVTLQANKNIKVTLLSIHPWQSTSGVTGTKPSAMEFVQIRPGYFQMGSPDTASYARDNEKPQHWVHIDKGFLMSKHLVTRQQYADFLNATHVPYTDGSVEMLLDGVQVIGFENFQVLAVNEAGKWFAHYPNAPIINVSTFGALAYAKWAGGTLPTEKQWEYACRAGTTTQFFFGEDLSFFDEYAVQNLNSDPPINVGTKKPNPWGLYDMQGLIAEFCFATDPYPVDALTKETAVVGFGTLNDNFTDLSFYLRGGFYSNVVVNQGSAFRQLMYNYNMRSDVGFRIVINPE